MGHISWLLLQAVGQIHQPLAQRRPAWVSIPFCNSLHFAKWRGKHVSTARNPILWFLILPLAEVPDLSKKTLEESPQWRASKAARKCTLDKRGHNHFKIKIQLQSKHPHSVYYQCKIRSTKSQELPLYIPDLCRTSGSWGQVHQT